MTTKKSKPKPFYTEWLKPNRIVPVLTVLGAGTALVLEMLGIFEFTIFEQIVIGLLAFLSIDGLTERITILESIEEKLHNIPIGQNFRQRIDIPKIEEQTSQAREIIIMAASAVTVTTNYAHYFEEKMKQGCKFKIVLLNPDGPSMKSWVLLNKLPTAEQDIRQSLEQIRKLAQIGHNNGYFSVRLIDVFLPYSMFAVDLNSKKNGSIVIEFHGYKLGSRERPHVYLTYKNTPDWYNNFYDQFNHVWSESVPWIP